MAETKETKSTSKEKFGQSEFKFCCGDAEEMSRMIRNFCSTEGGTFDCGEMMHKMQKMCCASPEKSGH